ncbi:MAG: hypothetical protein LBJ00_01830 [Planctomycetaceae bacterium]|nr:hypothetical protein [Planctomycetaceae bacterium]
MMANCSIPYPANAVGFFHADYGITLRSIANNPKKTIAIFHQKSRPICFKN